MDESKFFNKHSEATWWNPKHPFWPLNLYNKIRVPFICDNIGKHLSKRLQECHILDVGCGGGYLAETLALKGATVLGIDTSAGAIEVIFV
jgi:2-polyprenyl-6-hydroxyphenyl methylase / 3-demethylubiquinone-9 3-methyltransferase